MNYYIFESIQKITDLSLVSNSSIISVKLDKNEIIIVQFSDFSLYGFHMLNGIAVNIDPNLQSMIGTSILK